MKPQIQTSITTSDLSETTKAEMWEVYRPYYHYEQEHFMQRIQTNNYYSFYTVADKIIGFTGLRINRTTIGGRRQLLIYFGQTVIHEKYRGKSLIPITAAKLCMMFWKEMMVSEVYFWADTLTYKAYLVFAKSAPEIYPSWKKATPPEIKLIMDHLGRTHYGPAYSPASGTISKEKVLVNDTTLTIPAKYQRDQDIHFYTLANPNYTQGHGLLTMVRMNGKNLRRVLYRYLQKMIASNTPTPRRFITKVGQQLPGQ